MPVLGSQLAGYVSHKPGDRLPLLSARPAVALVTLKRAATQYHFTEAAKVLSNDDGISRHRIAPFNAYYLT